MGPQDRSGDVIDRIFLKPEKIASISFCGSKKKPSSILETLGSSKNIDIYSPREEYKLIIRLERDRRYVKERYKILKSQKSSIDLSPPAFYIEHSDLRDFMGIIIYMMT